MIVDPPRATHPPATTAGPAAREAAISVRNLHKMYRIYDRPQDRLKQMVWRGRRRYGREFWALRDVSFDVHRGETVGVIGRNGSGKSTLLQIIAGTLSASSGEVWASGRLAALLELGSGFDPEFTGRENVFLNGAILGLDEREMARRFDEIAAFADIGTFIDQPVKTYSSGMFVRLAFAVQACVDPDILLVDEALAVGDIFFRQKCYQRLERLRERGTAIILVSHSMMEVEQFCERAVLLHRGDQVFVGPSAEATKLYMLLDQQERADRLMAVPDAADHALDPAFLASPDDFWPAPASFIGAATATQVTNGWATCLGVAICDGRGAPCHVFQQGQRASFFFEFELLHDIEVPVSGMVIHNDKGTLVHGKSTLEYGADVPRAVRRGSRLRVRQDIALELAQGEYTFEPGLSTMPWQNYQRRDTYSYADLEACMLRLCHLPSAAHFVVVHPQKQYPIQLLHHGIANLPGQSQLAVLPPGADQPQR